MEDEAVGRAPIAMLRGRERIKKVAIVEERLLRGPRLLSYEGEGKRLSE